MEEFVIPVQLISGRSKKFVFCAELVLSMFKGLVKVLRGISFIKLSPQLVAAKKLKVQTKNLNEINFNSNYK